MSKQTTQPTSPDKPRKSRWEVLRDVLVFQAKLIVDGLRDLILSPISLMAGIIGLTFNPEDPGYLFRRVLYWGSRSEKWINLFGRWKPQESSIDELFSKLERRIVSDYQEGGVTASAKNFLEKSLDTWDEQIKELKKQANKPNKPDHSSVQRLEGPPKPPSATK